MSEVPGPQNPQEPNSQQQIPSQDPQQQPGQHGHASTPAHATQFSQQYAQQYPQQQYPTPYSPYSMPQANMLAYGQQQGSSLLGKMTRAAILLYINGGLLALAGLSCVGIAMVAWEEIFSKMPMDPSFSELTPEFLRGILVTMGGLISLCGVIFLVLGIFVHKRSRGAAITAIVFTALALVLLSCLGITSVIQGGQLQQGRGESMMGTCMMLVPFATMVWQLIWCIGAARAAGEYRAMQTQLQMQYWQYMQMQQAYAQQMQTQGQGTKDMGQGGVGGAAAGQPPTNQPPSSPNQG